MFPYQLQNMVAEHTISLRDQAAAASRAPRAPRNRRPRAGARPGFRASSARARVVTRKAHA
jgi:hypothetical protein